MWISRIQQHVTWGGGTTDDNNKDTFTTKHTKTNHTSIHKSTIRGVFKNMGNSFIQKAINLTTKAVNI